MESPACKTSIGHAVEVEEEEFGYAMHLVVSSVLPMTMQAAIELGVFEMIAKEGRGAKVSASEIAAQIETENPDAPKMLDRILRLLATHQVLDCSVDGLVRFYSLNSISRYFVPNEDGVSLSPVMALIQDEVFLASWSQLKDAIVEGGVPFDRVHGANTFVYPSLNPRFNQVFNAAMVNHTTIVIKKILKAYKGFEQLKQLVDVGGGMGHTLNAITSQYTHIKGINFDLPHVIEHAPPYPGVEHVEGDMFESVPKGDAIFMKWILHDWSDDHCLTLLKNCYKSIPDDGMVIIVDMILPVMAETSGIAKTITECDMVMLTQDPGGKERTEHEFLALATAAGFRGIRFQSFVCNFWVMEFYK